MIIVSDTTSLYYAVKIECDFLFPLLFGEVYIPTAVRDELLADEDQIIVEKLLQKPWLRVQGVSNQDFLKSLLTQIDLGEAEAITLAIELYAADLLIDERRGTAIALALNLKPIGLLGFLLLAKEKKYIQAVQPFLTRLIENTNFRYTDALIKSVLEKANEL